MNHPHRHPPYNYDDKHNHYHHEDDAQDHQNRNHHHDDNDDDQATRGGGRQFANSHRAARQGRQNWTRLLASSQGENIFSQELSRIF